MTTYTILSARYANESNTAAVLDTQEAGAVLASATDMPELWAALLAWGVPDAYAAPPVPVADISDRQFYQALADRAMITQAESLAAVKTGDIPAALQAIVDSLPADTQFAAEMLLSGATVFKRDHPLSAAIGQAYGMTPAGIDDLFRYAATL